MTASMGEILDSDYSGFLPLLIFSPSPFSPQNLSYLRLANLGPSMSTETFGGSQLGCMAM